MLSLHCMLIFLAETHDGYKGVTRQMKHINWSRHLLAGLVAEVVLLSAFALLFGNPISRGIIYTPQAGQSEKLLAVWFGIQPLPAVTPFWDQLFTFNARKVSVLALFFLWALCLVWGYAGQLARTGVAQGIGIRGALVGNGYAAPRNFLPVQHVWRAFQAYALSVGT